MLGAFESDTLTEALEWRTGLNNVAAPLGKDDCDTSFVFPSACARMTQLPGIHAMLTAARTRCFSFVCWPKSGGV